MPLPLEQTSGRARRQRAGHDEVQAEAFPRPNRRLNPNSDERNCWCRKRPNWTWWDIDALNEKCGAIHSSYVNTVTYIVWTTQPA